MRKLSPWIPEFALHSGLARIAITEIGLTKGFREKNRMTRTTAILDDSRTIGQGDYDAWFDDGTGLVFVQTDVEGQRVHWMFTWPDLKLDGWLSLDALEEVCKSIPGG